MPWVLPAIDSTTAIRLRAGRRCSCRDCSCPSRSHRRLPTGWLAVRCHHRPCWRARRGRESSARNMRQSICESFACPLMVWFGFSLSRSNVFWLLGALQEGPQRCRRGVAALSCASMDAFPGVSQRLVSYGSRRGRRRLVRRIRLQQPGPSNCGATTLLKSWCNVTLHVAEAPDKPVSYLLPGAYAWGLVFLHAQRHALLPRDLRGGTTKSGSVQRRPRHQGNDSYAAESSRCPVNPFSTIVSRWWCWRSVWARSALPSCRHPQESKG